MLARVYSFAVLGLEGVVVEVKVDTAQGLPGTDIVGLPDNAVKASRQRVQAAVKHAGLPFDRSKSTITSFTLRVDLILNCIPDRTQVFFACPFLYIFIIQAVHHRSNDGANIADVFGLVAQRVVQHFVYN